jgi:hypothetical protein
MAFEVSRDTEQPKIQNDGMKYEGLRFRAECRLARKLYGQAFGVDVAFRDPIIGEPETVATDDVLAFAGITPPVVRLYPVETHIAEKLHAYTMPRARPNTRVKDLPDIALLATTGPLDATRGSTPWEYQREMDELNAEYRAVMDRGESIYPKPGGSINEKSCTMTSERVARIARSVRQRMKKPSAPTTKAKWICAGSSEKRSSDAWLSTFRPGGSLELSERVRRCSLHGLPSRVNE